MVECMAGGSLQCACLHLENQKTERTGYGVLRWSHLSGLYSPAKPFVPKCPTSSQNSAMSWRPRDQTRDHMARVGVGSLLHIQSIAVVFPETEIVRASGFGLSKKQENCSRVPYLVTSSSCLSLGWAMSYGSIFSPGPSVNLCAVIFMKPAAYRQL